MNKIRIKAVYNALGELQKEVVFVGGSVVELYIDTMASEVRPTDDVDIVVEIWTYKEYAALEERLRKIGFVNDIHSKVICRYQIHGVIVDVMPIGEDVLNFKSKWYADGFKNAILHTIDEHCTIKILEISYFIASKLEAFIDRGNNDGRSSTDFEDIIYLFENRRSVFDEMQRADLKVKNYLVKEFRKLLLNPFFEEWVGAHADFGTPPATYYIIEQLELFCKI